VISLTKRRPTQALKVVIVTLAGTKVDVQSVLMTFSRPTTSLLASKLRLKLVTMAPFRPSSQTMVLK